MSLAADRDPSPLNLEGVFPPMPTPFDAQGQVDSTAITSNIERWIAQGVRGVVALGSNGEAPLLDEEESDAVVAAAREAVPSDRVLIAGTGRESTKASVAASQRAAALGADAVLVRTPSYFRARMTHEAFVAHYSAIADAVAVPVLLYNYPAITGVTFTPDTVAKLAEHPNIAGMKETSTDAAQMAAYMDAAAGQQFSLLAGSAPGFYAALCLGAAGGIVAAACVVPRACVALFDAFRRREQTESRDLQRRIVPIAVIVTSGLGVPGLKAAMDLAGYSGGDPRRPLLPAPASALPAIRAALAPVQDFL